MGVTYVSQPPQPLYSFMLNLCLARDSRNCSTYYFHSPAEKDSVTHLSELAHLEQENLYHGVGLLSSFKHCLVKPHHYCIDYGIITNGKGKF